MQTRVYYFQAGPTFAEEKPYGFKFPPQDARIPRTNMEQHEHDCDVSDLRGKERDFTIEKNGFTVFKLGNTFSMSYEDYHDEEKIQKYFRLLEAMLKAHLQAKDVKVFRWGVWFFHFEAEARC